MSKQATKRVRRRLGLEVSRDPLPSTTALGGYPLRYICADGGQLCPACANREIVLIDAAAPRGRRRSADPQWNIEAVEVNYEDNGATCDHCSNPIPAAYAAPSEV